MIIGTPVFSVDTNKLSRLEDNLKFNNGILFLNLNKYNNALQEFGEYVEIYYYGIHRKEAFKNIGDIYFTRFNFIKALNTYRALYEEFSNTREGSEAHLQMGICYLKMGYYDNAEKIFKSIIDTSTDPSIVQSAKIQLDLIDIVHK
jgi:tetratricopeptide (TPR) repeat protein